MAGAEPKRLGNPDIYRNNIDALYLKRAVSVSLILHGLFLLIRAAAPIPEMKLVDNAIKVTMASPEQVIKNKLLQTKSPFKESEVIKKAPKKKIITGTQKVVPNSEVLGNPKEKVVQKVQKGDPTSKDFSKYKPGTDFRKMSQTNIGTGAKGKDPSKDGGGGSGDTYKGFDFATASKNATRKGYRFKSKDGIDDGGAGSGKGGSVGDGVGGGFGDGSLTGTTQGTMKRADILTNVGSLTGASEGKIASSKGAEGLSRKGSIMMAGVPSETVVLGSIDPEAIRRILREHIPQFRYCYQSELDKSNKPGDLSGILHLNFTIGMTGKTVSQNLTGDQNFTGAIKDCVGNVLKGIQFPQPKGSGNVEVKQAINFYPQRL